MSLGDLAHDLAHLVELLDQLLDRLHVGARAAGDPQSPGALDQLGVAPLLGRHREDDRLQSVELALVELDPAQLLADAGDHPQQRLQRAHAADLAHLVQEVVEAELRLAQLLPASAPCTLPNLPYADGNQPPCSPEQTNPNKAHGSKTREMRAGTLIIGTPAILGQWQAEVRCLLPGVGIAALPKHMQDSVC